MHWLYASINNIKDNSPNANHVQAELFSDAQEFGCVFQITTKFHSEGALGFGIIWWHDTQHQSAEGNWKINFIKRNHEDFTAIEKSY